MVFYLYFIFSLTWGQRWFKVTRFKVYPTVSLSSSIYLGNWWAGTEPCHKYLLSLVHSPDYPKGKRCTLVSLVNNWWPGIFWKLPSMQLSTVVHAWRARIAEPFPLPTCRWARPTISELLFSWLNNPNISSRSMYHILSHLSLLDKNS